MPASSRKMLLTIGALGVVGAGLAFVCARGLHFSDPNPVRPAAVALQEPVWPVARAIPSPPAAVEASRAVEPPQPQPQIGTPGTPLYREQGRAADTATELLNGFLGQQRPEGRRSIQVPQMAPEQAAAAARTASDLINGMMGSSGKSGLVPAQIDRDQAAATAESAARVLNGMFGGRGLGASGSDEGAAPMALDHRSDRKHRN